MADMFQHLNELNTRMQGNENLLTNTDKIMDSVQRCSSGNNTGKYLGMLPLTQK